MRERSSLGCCWQWLRGVQATPRPGSPAAVIIKVDATGVRCPDARFTRIQDAIDAAKNNNVIQVCPGTYPEQLTIAKKVKVIGFGRPVIRPTAMVANSNSIRTGAPIAAAAVVTATATLDGLEFDLTDNGVPGCDEGDPMLAGVYFRGASGTLKNSRVHGVMLPPAGRTCESGVAVLAQGGGVKSSRVDVSRNVIYDYQRAGIVVNERGVRSTVRSNTVTGAGVTSDVVQNGIQVGFDAVAVITNNTVQNNTGPSGSECTFDAGNLVYLASGGVISGNTFTGNASGVIVSGNRNRVLRNTVDGLSGGVPAGLDGISVFGDANVLVSNTVRNLSEVGVRLFGNANLAIRNVIVDTHEATLCAAARALPGCATELAVCGVGLWIMGGQGNAASRNVLANNDIGLRDEGLRTVLRGRH